MQGIRRWPSSIRVVRLLALLLAVLLNFSTALAQAKGDAKSEAGTTAEAHLGKGYEALKQDRYEVAATEFRAALKLDPKLVLRAQFPLAVALFELHKPDEARSEFEAVRRATGEHPNISYYLGRLDLEKGDFPSAARNLTKAVEEPPFPDTAYYLGYTYFKQGDLVNAEKWLKQAAEANPRDARMQYQLGLVYRKEGKEDEARKALALSEGQRQRDTSDSRLRLECAQKLDAGSREEARTVCEQLYDPDNAEKLTELGTIYGRHGDPQSALRPLQRAAELAPHSPQMQYNVALAYFQLNQFAEARKSLESAVARWPDIFQLSALYGVVLAKLGEDVPAYEALHHAHELNPQDAPTADMLYLTSLGLGRKRLAGAQYDEAIHYFEEALKVHSSEPAPHRGIAQVYGASGRPEKAAAEEQEADRLANAAAARQ